VDATPVPGEVALAGADGKALAKLVAQSKAYGVRVMADVVAHAVRGYKGAGPLLSEPHLERIAGAISAVNATAELLGRSRVAERSDRVRVFGDAAPPDVPFQSFADNPPGILATPEDAVAFFMSRRPELGLDPLRFGELQRRQAFTLAESTNLVLTQRIQKIIGDAMRANRGTAEAQTAIRKALESAGVAPANPQYSEMVFRTNAMDSFQQGMYEQGRGEEDAFPVWRYLIVDDERTGEDHRPKGNRYYPRTATFSEVRGNRPFNCRCSLQWVDRFEWETLKRGGARVETDW
jgi:hypothetical protein